MRFPRKTDNPFLHSLPLDITYDSADRGEAAITVNAAKAYGHDVRFWIDQATGDVRVKVR